MELEQQVELEKQLELEWLQVVALHPELDLMWVVTLGLELDLTWVGMLQQGPEWWKQGLDQGSGERNQGSWLRQVKVHLKVQSEAA